MSDPRWVHLEAAEPLLLSEFAAERVAAIRFVASFPHSDSVGVWLCTSTDADKALLIELSGLAPRAAECLRSAGFETLEERDVIVVVESDETVEREFQGSWFYAMR